MNEKFWLIHGDNRDFYPRIGRVDAVITDPPYGDKVHDLERVARQPNGDVGVSPIPFDKLDHYDIWSLLAFLETKCRAWGVVFCQTEDSGKWRDTAELRCENARYFRPMLWIKPDAKPNFRGHGPGVGHETMVTFWCGEGLQKWNGGGKVGVFYHLNSAQRELVKHPTHKPLPLMKELIRLFTNPGDVVFDPFMGCGSTGVAALELGRRFVGIEKDEAFYNEAKRRIEHTLANRSLFEPESSKAQTLLGDSAFGNANTKKRLIREAKERNGGQHAVTDT